jgi:hypothetical protein
MRRLLSLATLGLTVLFVAVLFAVPAFAGGYDYDPCKHKPWKCETTTTLAEETTTLPEETTTLPEETTTLPEETTTLPEETTTTVEETTTTTGEPTTTEPLGFSYALLCAEAGGTIIEVHVVGLQPGDIVSGGGDTVEVLTTRANLSVTAPATFDVLVNGTSLGTISEDERADCEQVQGTSTSLDTDEPEAVLPFTGVDSTVLAAAGWSLVLAGSLMVFLGKRQRQDR